MASILKEIKPFKSGNNPAASWGDWKEHFKIYLVASKYKKEDEETQISFFLHHCGDELFKIYKTLNLPVTTDDPLTVDRIYKAFDEHFVEYKNEAYATFVFFNLYQGEGQPFDDFLTRVKDQAEQCEFDTAKDNLVKNKIIHKR